MKPKLGFLLTAIPACAQGRADPTSSETGDPSGAIRALTNASEDKPGRQITHVPRMNPRETEPHGPPADTADPAR